MIKCQEFYRILEAEEITFFAGVPDSLLKDFCAYLADRAAPETHIIAANEGNAIALACGYHLGTNKIGLVYMQNSGLGNAINPLLSLADPKVYQVPILLLIGWRGEPGVKDEPQHKKQGVVTQPLLEALDIPFEVLPAELSAAEKVIKQAVSFIRREDRPFALIVRKSTFEQYRNKEASNNSSELTREQAIKAIIAKLGPDDLVVSTTGKTSRELFELREQNGQAHDNDFLVVGSMGHSSQIALAIALNQKKKQVFCLDGDGSVIMHMGALAINGAQKAANFKHVILNNGVHDSVGGQPTAATGLDFPAIALACGYQKIWQVADEQGLFSKLDQLKNVSGPALLEIKVKAGARGDLGRPTQSPVETKKRFMEKIKNVQ